MIHFITVYVPWMLSVLTLTMMWMIGNKNRYAWHLGLANQVLWLTWIITVRSWGLLILTCCLIVMYIRNLRKWSNE